MKDWIKKKLVMTPSKRFFLAYTNGAIAAIIGMTIPMSVTADDGIHWGVWAVLFAINTLIYARNNNQFNKETLWMTIKNPAKVTREEGTDIFGKPLMRPTAPPPPGSRPPPPPPPPAGRSVRGPT